MTFSNLKFDILTKRVRLRTLSHHDNFADYLAWMRNVDNRFISSIKPDTTLDNLKKYVDDKNLSDSTILLGMFSLIDGTHVGNIKFEPIDLENHTAVLGILIGDHRYRGIGLAAEVIEGCSKYLFKHHNISRFFLGVDKQNNSAISAYKKCGFQIAKIPLLNLPDISHEMILEVKF